MLLHESHFNKYCINIVNFKSFYFVNNNLEIINRERGMIYHFDFFEALKFHQLAKSKKLF